MREPPKKPGDPVELANFVATLTAEHPDAVVSWLAELKFITVSASVGTRLGNDTSHDLTVITDAAADVRASGLFEAPVWDGQVFRFPNTLGEWPDVTLDGLSTLEPECLRTDTKQQRDDGLFTTMPSLATPLGTGPSANPNACP